MRSLVRRQVVLHWCQRYVCSLDMVDVADTDSWFQSDHPFFGWVNESLVKVVALPLRSIFIVSLRRHITLYNSSI